MASTLASNFVHIILATDITGYDQREADSTGRGQDIVLGCSDFRRCSCLSEKIAFSPSERASGAGGVRVGSGTFLLPNALLATINAMLIRPGWTIH